MRWTAYIAPVLILLAGVAAILIVLLKYANTSSAYFRNPTREKLVRDTQIVVVSRAPPKHHVDVFAAFDHVLYINLDRRPDRRSEIESELDRLGVPTAKRTRIPGVIASKGNIGCTKAHICALQKFKSHPEWKTCVVLEDDFEVAQSLEHVIHVFDAFQAAGGDDWDVLILSGGILKFKINPKFGLDVLQVLASTCTDGYIVNRRYVDTLLANFEEGLEKLEKSGHHKYHIDMYWHRAMPESTWFAFNPLIGKQRQSKSDVPSSKQARSFINNRGLVTEPATPTTRDVGESANPEPTRPRSASKTGHGSGKHRKKSGHRSHRRKDDSDNHAEQIRDEIAERPASGSRNRDNPQI